MKIVRFIVGQDERANWIVHDRLGVTGGIFISEAVALQFARREACRDMTLVSIADEGAIVDFAEGGEKVGYVSGRRAA